MAENKANKLNHNLIVENRKNVTVSGVTEIGSFDEKTVVLYTDYGGITVTGSELHMSKLSVDSGDVDISGHIKSLVYTDTTSKREGIVKKLFK